MKKQLCASFTIATYITLFVGLAYASGPFVESPRQRSRRVKQMVSNMMGKIVRNINVTEKSRYNLFIHMHNSKLQLQEVKKKLERCVQKNISNEERCALYKGLYDGTKEKVGQALRNMIVASSKRILPRLEKAYKKMVVTMRNPRIFRELMREAYKKPQGSQLHLFLILFSSIQTLQAHYENAQRRGLIIDIINAGRTISALSEELKKLYPDVEKRLKKPQNRINRMPLGRKDNLESHYKKYAG